MRPRHHACTALLALALAVGAIAAAQGGAYTNDERFDVALELPAGWTAADAIDASGMLTLEAYPPSGAGLVMLVVTPITPADRGYWSSPLDALLDDVWTGFQPEVPGARPQQRYDVDLPHGLRARALDFADAQLAGTMVLVVGPQAVYTFISAADAANLATVRSGLETMVVSLAPPSVQRGAAPPAAVPRAPGATPPAPPAAGGNPLDPPAPGANPLDPPAPRANPLDLAPVDAWSGRFGDGIVEVTLERSGNGYVGTLAVAGSPYPLEATVVSGVLVGHFGDGVTRYAFEATLEGDVMTLASDGDRFDLQRRP